MRFSLSENNIRKLEVTVIPAPKPDPKPGPEAPRVSPSPGEVLRKRLLPVLRRMASRITPRHLRLAAAFLCLAGGVFLLGYSLFHAEAAFTRTVLELGTPVSANPADYLDGGVLTCRLAKVDLSEVDETCPGTYPVTVSCFRKTWSCTLELRDTVPPAPVLRSGPFYFAPGDAPDPKDFLLRVRDADPRITCRFDPDFCPGGIYRCAEPGEYTIPLVVSDSSGNVFRTAASFTVDLPPEILGVRDFYLTPGTDVDFSSNVSVLDLTDGDLTDSLTVDDTSVRTDTAGEYPLRYAAADRYGLRRELCCTVHVLDAAPLQELIGSRSISHRDVTILGAPNPYDTGARSGLTMEETLQECAPAMVQLYHSSGENGYACGSGFVTEITPEGLYICSNAHVIGDFSGWTVYFHDGTAADGFALGTSDRYDIGVVFVPSIRLPSGYAESLSTVHIDVGRWNALSADPRALPLGLAHIGQSGEIEYTSTGTLVCVHQRFSYFQGNDQTEVTLQLIHGDSGSAILDETGSLIGVGFAYSLEPEVHYWAVPLDAFLSCYEEITGRIPYTY